MARVLRTLPPVSSHPFIFWNARRRGRGRRRWRRRRHRHNLYSLIALVCVCLCAHARKRLAHEEDAAEARARAGVRPGTFASHPGPADKRLSTQSVLGHCGAVRSASAHVLCVWMAWHGMRACVRACTHITDTMCVCVYVCVCERWGRGNAKDNLFYLLGTFLRTSATPPRSASRNPLGICARALMCCQHPSMSA